MTEKEREGQRGKAEPQESRCYKGWRRRCDSGCTYTATPLRPKKFTHTFLLAPQHTSLLLTQGGGEELTWSSPNAARRIG